MPRLASFLLALPAAAQVEVGATGNTGVGTPPYRANRRFVVQAPYVSTPGQFTELILAEYAGGSPALNLGYQWYVTGIGANAMPQAGYGIGVHANGGYLGVYGNASMAGSGNRHGVWGYAAGGAVNHGVYGETASTSSGNYAGYFKGNVYVTGSLTQFSDGRLKEEVQALGGEGVLAKLMRLSPKSYRYRASERARLGLPEGLHLGLVAQEVETVFPELVTEQTHVVATERDEQGRPVGREEEVVFKGVNYLEMVPLLLQAIQEQQAEIEALRAKVQALEQQ